MNIFFIFILLILSIYSRVNNFNRIPNLKKIVNSQFDRAGGNILIDDNDIININNKSDLITLVNNAVNLNYTVRIIGSKWSWNTLRYSKKGYNIQLSGNEFNFINYDKKTNLVEVGSAAKIYDVHNVIESNNREIRIKGGCLSAYTSQTMAGIIANNVHDIQPYSLDKHIKSIKVLAFNNHNKKYEIQNFEYNSDEFNSTIGSAGLTGIIISALIYTYPMEGYYSIKTTNILKHANESYNDFIKNVKKTINTDLFATQSNWQYMVDNISLAYKTSDITNIQNLSSSNGRGIKDAKAYKRQTMLFGGLIQRRKMNSFLEYLFKRKYTTNVVTFSRHSSGPGFVEYSHHIETEIIFPLNKSFIGNELIEELKKNSTIYKNIVLILRPVPSSFTTFISPYSTTDKTNKIFITFDIKFDNATFKEPILKIIDNLCKKYTGFIRIHTGKSTNITSLMYKNSFERESYNKAINVINKLDPNKVFRSMHTIHNNL